MLKLSSINPKRASNEGVDVPILIDGEPTGAVIKVRGKYSDVAEKLQREAVRRLQRQYTKSNKFVPPDPVDAEEERIAYAVACTIGWSGIEGEDGKPLEFSAEAATKVYGLHKWILDQVDKAIGDDALFLKA